MIPAAFEYFSPTTLGEALDLLAEYGDEAKVLTGGHSLIPALKLRLAAPAAVIDLRRVPGLSSIEPDGSGVRIGALARHCDVETSTLVKERCPLLAEAAGEIGDVQVRNAGTLAGSVCHADPAADYPAALLALDAEVELESSGGKRSIRCGDFIRGMFETALQPGEIIAAVRVPAAHSRRSAYLKMRQNASGFALVGVAAQLEVERGRVKSAAVGVTGVARRAYRAAALEKRLNGLEVSGITDAVVADAARGITGGMDLLGDIHASSEFRSHLAEVYARRAVLLAAARS